MADEFNVIFDVPAPGPLAECAGVKVDDYTSLEAPVALQAVFGKAGVPLEGSAWAELSRIGWR